MMYIARISVIAKTLSENQKIINISNHWVGYQNPELGQSNQGKQKVLDFGIPLSVIPLNP